MTALYMDGFAHYGGNTGNMLEGPYAAMPIASNGYGCTQAPYNSPTGTYCFYVRTSILGGQGFRRVLPAPKNKLFMSFRYAIPFLPDASRKYALCQWNDASNNTLYTLGLSSTGALEIWSGYYGTQIAVTSGPVIVGSNFHFIETCYDITTYTLSVRVDDAQAANPPVLSATIGSTAVAQNVFLSFGGNGGGADTPHYITDLFVRDDAGTINNGWLGDRRVATLFVNADTTVTGWTPSYYKEFGTGILQLTTANAYVSSAGATALDLGNSDFTLESFVRFQTLPSTTGYSSIFSRWDASGNKRSYRLILGGQTFNNSCLQFDTSTDGTSGTQVTKIQYPWTPTLNMWHHIAIVRSAGQLLLFVDGQQLGLPINDSSTYFGAGSEVLAIGAETGSGGIVPNSNLTGWLDETRITNGFGRYTGPFAVPTSAFPRGSGSDAYWSQVSLLMGYDSSIADESGFARVVTANNGASQFLPTDGPTVGKYSAVGKQTPDDNTFISASLLNATNILTMTTQPSNGDTVTVGTKDGTTAAVYTFKTTVASAFDVLIDTTAQNTLTNLFNAINLGAGAGTKFGTGTTVNFDVNATQLPVGQIQVTANIAGTGGNSIASTSTGTAAHWATTTLTGGSSIPGAIQFKMQRPPINTTVISALQTTVRAYKSDAGTANMQASFVGVHGGSDVGANHPLTVSPVYYGDIMEADPDSSGPITPTSIVNGYIQINRTA